MSHEAVIGFRELINAYVVTLAWKALGALAIWIVGGWVIRLGVAGFGRALAMRQVDKTLASYLQTGAGAVLKVLVFIALLSVLGIETTSFAALLAALGIAIGAAWAGLLANFAAGLFLVVLRPFKVGDMITAGGVTGAVREIGLFATTIDTADNLRTTVGNNKIFADSICNYDANAYRRVDLTAQLAHGVDPQDAARSLVARLVRIPNVLTAPAPSVEILQFNPMGTVLAVRPFCHNRDYWQVYFDTNRAIAEIGRDSAWPVPETRHFVQSPPA
jgi:small conductance mechanosensitive channel